MSFNLTEVQLSVGRMNRKASANGLKTIKGHRPHLAIPVAIPGKIENEIEARFLVPKKFLEPHLASCKRIRIRQFYISKKEHPRIIRTLLNSVPKVAPLLNLEIKTIRLRSQQPEGLKTQYYLQLKTPKNFISQTEVSLPVSRSLFIKLISLADDGFVSKTRFIKNSYCNISGRREKIEAHIDLIDALGLGKDRLTGNRLPEFLEDFAIAEIELPHEGCYRVLKQRQWKTFSFLKNSLDLQDIKDRSSEKLSFKSLYRGKKSRSKIQKIFNKVRKAA